MIIPNLFEIGCLDRSIDCRDCEYCHQESNICRSVACNCELPTCTEKFSFATKYQDYENNYGLPCPSTNHSNFVDMEEIVYCTQEKEVECDEGYVHFEIIYQVGSILNKNIYLYSKVKKILFFSDSILISIYFCTEKGV